MASSPSPATTGRLRPPPTILPRHTYTSTSTSCRRLPRGLLTLSSASRASSTPIWQSPTSPLAGRSLLRSPIRCSRDPGEIGAANVKNIEQTQGFSSDPRSNDKELLEKLKRYGVSGVLSYGLLNTVYYITTFVLVWFYFSPAPGRMGYAAVVERALALAPFADRGLRWFTVKFKFQSEGKAFAAIVGFCFALAVLLFFGLTLLWA